MIRVHHVLSDEPSDYEVSHAEVESSGVLIVGAGVAFYAPSAWLRVEVDP